LFDNKFIYGIARAKFQIGLAANVIGLGSAGARAVWGSPIR